MVIKKIDSKIFTILCFLLLYLFLSNMTGVYGNYLPFHDYVLTIVFFVSIIGIINRLIKRKTKINVFLIVLLVFLTLIGVRSFLFFMRINFSLIYTINQMMHAILWIFVLLYSYLISQTNPEIIKIIKRMIYVLPIYLIAYIGIKNFSANRGISLISSVYYLIFLLPILMLHKNKLIKTSGFIFIIYALLLSQKRTGLIAIVAYVFFYYIFSSKINSKRWKDILKSIFIFILGISIIFLGVYIISKNYNIELLQKMQRISEDGGSGRTEIWIIILDSFKDSNIINLIFGHGFNSVYYNFSFQLSAHNDFIEILYDYGILGIILYLKILLTLIKKGFRLLKEKHYIAPSFLSSIAFAITFSLTSHLIIYPTYFLFLCIFWGYCLGIKSEKKEGANEES